MQLKTQKNSFVNQLIMEIENAREHLDTQIQNAYKVVALKINKDKTDGKL
jgi:hypothetical protein